MAEIKYKSVREWLDRAKELRAAGKEPKCVDDPLRRLLGFSDSDEDFHYIQISGVLQYRQELSAEEQGLLSSVSGRRTLIEVGLSDPPKGQ